MQPNALSAYVCYKSMPINLDTFSLTLYIGDCINTNGLGRKKALHLPAAEWIFINFAKLFNLV